MRVRSAALLVFIVCLLPIVAQADISSISPSSIPYGTVEVNVTIFGSELSGTESTLIVWDGPDGHYEFAPINPIENDDPEAPPHYPSNMLVGFIPGDIPFTPGTYEIRVVAKDFDFDARTLGPAFFTVGPAPVDVPPIMSYTETVFAEATSASGAIVSYDVSAQNPNGDPVPVTCSQASGTTFPIGTTAVSCQATNSFGTSTAVITVIVADTTVPIVTVPGDIETTDTVVTFTASATDNIDGPVAVTCSPASGSTFGPGVTQVVCRAEDSSNNIGVGVFNVIRPGGLPVLTVPADITVTSPDGNPVTVDYTVTATNDATIECLPSGNTFPVGTTTVTCTATNFTGSDTETFRIIVLSGAAPEITVPADITAEATSSAGATVTFVVTATNEATIVCTPPSGSTFALGETTVTCTATNAGGSDTGTFKVTVVDTTPPVLDLPADITAEATSASGAEVTYTATASDLVDSDVPVQCTPASGSTFALGTTTVSCSATDDSGNSATGSFNVTVVDSTPPQILSVDATPGVLWPPNHQMVNVTVTVVAIDLVDPTPVSHIVSVTSNQPVNGTGDGDTAPDWVITGPLTVQLRSERSHGQDRIYTITIETVDDAGNVSTATDTVVVTNTKRRAVH
jgi:hypothetical protein